MEGTQAVVATTPNQAVALTLNEKDIKAHIQLIQRVMRSVMKEGTHYGKIPGTDKPTLYKPGAEVLCATFRIAPSYRVDDLSDDDAVRYRVTCVGTHQVTGAVLGEGMGEASTNEEKYRWRNAVCNEEFDETPEDRKRVKWQRSKDGATYRREMVRTTPADVANTVLKMACKRAQVAMTLNVTAASDIFTQDLEDMPEELRGQDGGSGEPQQRQQPQQRRPTTQAPRSTNGNGGNGNGQRSGGNVATGRQIGLVKARLDNAGIPENDLLNRYSIQRIDDLPFNQVDDALAWIAQADAA